MRRAGLLLAGAVVALAAWPSVALADSGLVLVDDDQSFERAAGTGGDETVDITLSNPSAQPVAIVAALAPGETTQVCKPVATKPASVAAQQEVTVTVTFADCPNDSDPTVRFVLNDDQGNSVLPHGATLVATPPSTPTPEWAVLRWFLYAGGAGFLIALVAWATWPAVDLKSRTRAAGGAKPTPARLSHPGWRDPLPRLASGWKFQDSWASNATVVAALFAGLFGATDVTTTILGSDAKKVLTTVAVAVALAVGLAAIAPMVLQACQTVAPAQVTPAGMVLASTLTIAATGGELWVTVLTVHGTVKLHHDWVIWVGVAGSLLVVAYAFSATWQNLSAGLDPDPNDKPGPALIPVNAIRALVRDILKELHKNDKFQQGITVDSLELDRLDAFEAATRAEGLPGPEEAAGPLPVVVERVSSPRPRKPSAIL